MIGLFLAVLPYESLRSVRGIVRDLAHGMSIVAAKGSCISLAAIKIIRASVNHLIAWNEILTLHVPMLLL